MELLYKRDYKTLDFVLSSIDKNTLDSENILYFEWFQAITTYHINNQLELAIKKSKDIDSKSRSWLYFIL